MIQQFNITERIINHLMLNTSRMKDLGLMHGQIGIIIFLKHYSHYVNKHIYSDFADELIDDVFEKINLDMAITFESGISGIGWGIEYLLENNFVEGDSNYVLEELDKRITQFDIRRIDDFSIETGMEGISYYISKRIKSSLKNNEILPFDDLYLSEWKSIYNKTIPSDKEILFNIIGANKIDDNIISGEQGLANGFSGWCLRKIL